MKKMIFLPALLAATFFLNAQTDYCSVIQKALIAVGDNYSSYKNFAYYTKGGQKAYYADYTFVPGEQAYIYKDTISNNHYYYQKLSASPDDYLTIYKAIESCLANETDRWTKLEDDAGTSVLFTCDKTGGQITLIKSGGVLLQIDRDPAKNKAVFASDFCIQLEKLTASCENDFIGCTGTQISTSEYSIRYKADFQLNQRGTGGSIEVGKDMFDPKQKYNYFIEIFEAYDITLADLVAEVEACLDEQGGWKKKEAPYDPGYLFKKGNVIVSVTSAKTFDNDPVADHFLKVITDY